jgi:hypothetical protein
MLFRGIMRGLCRRRNPVRDRKNDTEFSSKAPSCHLPAPSYLFLAVLLEAGG